MKRKMLILVGLHRWNWCAAFCFCCCGCRRCCFSCLSAGPRANREYIEILMPMQETSRAQHKLDDESNLIRCLLFIFSLCWCGGVGVGGVLLPFWRFAFDILLLPRVPALICLCGVSHFMRTAHRIWALYAYARYKWHAVWRWCAVCLHL